MLKREKKEPEEKIRSVQRYLVGKGSLRRIAAEAGVNGKTVEGWVRRYKTEGAEGFLPGKKNRVYSSELKLQSVHAYLSGEGSLAEICERNKIRDEKELRHWIKVYNAHGDFNSVRQSGGEDCMRQGRETTQAERLEIVKACLASGRDYGAA